MTLKLLPSDILLLKEMHIADPQDSRLESLYAERSALIQECRIAAMYIDEMDEKLKRTNINRRLAWTLSALTLVFWGIAEMWKHWN